MGEPAWRADMAGSVTHYQVCAVDLGVDPDGPHAVVLYDECVNWRAARSLLTWMAPRERFENSFLFIRRVTTTVHIERVAEGAVA